MSPSRYQLQEDPFKLSYQPINVPSENKVSVRSYYLKYFYRAKIAVHQWSFFLKFLFGIPAYVYS